LFFAGNLPQHIEIITMIEVKRMAAAGIEESAIQTELRWCFEKIKSFLPENEDKTGNKASGPHRRYFFHG
jgi:hypothetical protein